MKVNKKALVIAIIAFLLIVLGGTTKADYIDLSDGGVIVSETIRCDETPNYPLACVVVEKDSKRYVVVLDTKGEYKIYDVETGKLIWQRDSI